MTWHLMHDGRAWQSECATYGIMRVRSSFHLMYGPSLLTTHPTLTAAQAAGEHHQRMVMAITEVDDECKRRKQYVADRVRQLTFGPKA